MKSNISASLVIILTLLSLSCKEDLLDQPPYGVQTDDSFYKTASDLSKTLTAAYSYLNQTGFPPAVSTLWAIGDVGSDDANKGGAAPTNQPGIYELEIGQQKPTNTTINLFWTNHYGLIGACNLIIDKHTIVTGDATQIANIVGQAKFLRAYAYYRLVTNFGDLPMPLTFLEPSEVNLPRSSKSEVWLQIEKDLTDASTLPTKKQWGIANEGRATSGAALALLGKSFMFQKKFVQAEETFKKLIDQGSYELVADYGSIFRKASGDNNNAESIFDIKYKSNTGISPGEGSTNFYFMMPNDPGIGGGGYNEPTDDLVREFEKGDPRAIYSISFKGDVYPSGTTTYTQVNPVSASGRVNRKFFVVPSERSSATIFDESKTNHIIRYAEIVLLYAEALNENGKSAEALVWLNKVRQRARNTPAKDPQRVSTSFDLTYTGSLLPDVTTTDQAALRLAVWHEQRVELAMEGLRREYLVRTGRLSKQMTVAKGLPAVDAQFDLLPIPQSEIDLSNGQIVQNKGY